MQSVEAIREQVNAIQKLMGSVMKTDTHFGTIPGCGEKPTLLKPGAEKISSMFRLSPRYEVDRIDMGNGHREYEVKCSLYHAIDGTFCGDGVGSCTTMEGKFRFRQEVVDGLEVSKDYWDTRDVTLLGGPNRKPQKRGGKWVVVERVEHDNPADYYNTCLKMAKKRAHVDAVLTATAASDLFTQDIEDMPEVIEGAAKQKSAPSAPARKSDSQSKAPANGVGGVRRGGQ